MRGRVVKEGGEGCKGACGDLCDEMDAADVDVDVVC